MPWMPYAIVVHELAVQELESLRVFDERRIISEIEKQLTHHRRYQADAASVWNR